MSDTTVPVAQEPRVRSLAVDHVSQLFNVGGGMSLVAVNDVTLKVDSHPAGIISLVGASGSGKSTIARMLLGLQRPTKGRVTYDGKDVFRLSRAAYRQYRRDVQPVFQDPYAIFNPFYKADRVLRRAVKKFKLAKSGADGDAKIEQALLAVGLVPGDVLGRYGHQLSGGQRQRLMLARIHLLRPAFLIADEPVSMLDAQVRKGFLDLMIQFRQELGMTTLFITHDLSTVAYVGGTMITLFRGRIVEHGPVEQVLTAPSHPYTRLLLDSVPVPDPDQRWSELGERSRPAATPVTADQA